MRGQGQSQKPQIHEVEIENGAVEPALTAVE